MPEMEGDIVGVADWIEGPKPNSFAVRLDPSTNSINFGVPNFVSGQNGFTAFMQLRFMPGAYSVISSTMHLLFGAISLKINTSDLVVDPGVSATITNLTMELFDTNGTDYIRRACPGGITWISGTDDYHTVAITYNGKGKASGCRVYFDGQRRDSHSSSSTEDKITFAPTAALQALGNFPGDVAKVKFFNTALSARTIQDLHESVQP